MLIGDRYKLESDSLQYTLYEKIDKSPKSMSAAELFQWMAATGRTIDDDLQEEEEAAPSGWRAIGYFMTLKSALKYLVDTDIKGQGLDNLQQIELRQAQLYLVIQTLAVNELQDLVAKKLAVQPKTSEPDTPALSPDSSETHLSSTDHLPDSDQPHREDQSLLPTDPEQEPQTHSPD